MPATQLKCIYGGLTLDVDQHYIGSVTATTHKKKDIITLESNPLRGTVLPAPHGKRNKCDKNIKYMMFCHCGTNNRAPRWTFKGPSKPEVRLGAREDMWYTLVLSCIFPCTCTFSMYAPFLHWDKNWCLKILVDCFLLTKLLHRATWSSRVDTQNFDD